MNYIIKNDQLSVKISSLGGELQSIKSSDDTEYLWQGNPVYWNIKSPNLFPYIARLTDGKYIYNGTTYSMERHGFFRFTELLIINQESDTITFSIKDNDVTRYIYPFKFILMLTYTLSKNTILIDYNIYNNDERTMYFGLGGHPGFNVPIEHNLEFTDYYLEFSDKHVPTFIDTSDDCYITGQISPYKLKDDQIIPLKHNLFDHDALILTDVCKTISLKSDKSSKKISVSYNDMNYLGLWHKPKTDAPFICIEPWTSLPSRKNVIEDLATQPNLISLLPKETYKNQWSITIN